MQDATAAIDLGDIPAEDVHRVTVAVQGFLFSEVVSTEEALKLLAKGLFGTRLSIMSSLAIVPVCPTKLT